MSSGDEPVRWWVFDEWCQPLSGPVPPANAPCWEARYENDCEKGKRTTRDVSFSPQLARLFGDLRGRAAEWSARLGYAVEDDPTLHGGGLHVTGPGGHLATHLDYDLHPRLPGKRRALNLIAFLHPEWGEAWGGAFVLTDPVGGVVHRFWPRPGRLVAFETNDLSYHGVEPVTGPAERVTAAVYYLSAANPASTRRRALFLPAR